MAQVTLQPGPGTDMRHRRMQTPPTTQCPPQQRRKHQGDDEILCTLPGCEREYDELKLRSMSWTMLRTRLYSAESLKNLEWGAALKKTMARGRFLRCMAILTMFSRSTSGDKSAATGTRL